MSEEDTPVAAYAKATASLKKFISELEISNDDMKRVINDFSVDAKPLDVSKFADDVLGVLTNLSDETTYPNAKIAIEQINTIKKALAPESPAAEGSAAEGAAPLDSTLADAAAAPLASAGDDALAKRAAAAASAAAPDSADAPLSSAADDDLAKGAAASAAASDSDDDSVVVAPESDSAADAPGASAAAATSTVPVSGDNVSAAEGASASAADEAVVSDVEETETNFKQYKVLPDKTTRISMGNGKFKFVNEDKSITWYGKLDGTPLEGGKRRQSRTRNRNRNRNRSKSAHGSKRR